MTLEFSFKSRKEFSTNDYPIAVRDSKHKNNVLVLRHNDSEVLNRVAPDSDRLYISIDSYDSENTPLVQERFHSDEFVKISGKIVENLSIDPNIPKYKTYHTHLDFFDENELIEIFEGKIDEAKSTFEPQDRILDLLKNVYPDYENQAFFILTDVDRFVGPFCLGEKSSHHGVSIRKSDLLSFGEYETVPSSFEEITVNGIIRRVFIKGVHKLKRVSGFNFTSDEDLISDFQSNLVREKIFNTVELEKLTNLLTRVSGMVDLNKYSEQTDRLKILVQDSKRVNIKDTELTNVLSNLEESKKEIKELKSKRDELDSEVRGLKQDRTDIYESVQKIKEQEEKEQFELANIKEIKEKELEKQKSELEEVINSLREKQDNLKEEIELEGNKLRNYFKDIKKEIEDKRVIRKDLERGIETLQDKFIDAQRSAQKELMNLIENKTYFDFLSGRDISSYNEVDNGFTNYVIKSIREKEVLRNHTLEQLEAKNRKYPKHFIDNLLISIHQNTLTILAGLPGTGKTSLARILLNTITPKKRICEVSVNRGWTSQKDLIGFFNPLSKRFHASNTGVYDLLKQLDYEVEQKLFEDSPMSYIILDEANLSPIEHYWSCFYNLTDATAKDNRLHEINLGGNQVIKYANNLRFIGTINYDQTTEPLSPRVLDRANIIQIPNNKFSIIEITDDDIKTVNISYEQLREFYKLQDFSSERVNILFDEDQKEIYDEVSKLFGELSISISPRLEIAIQRYCLVAKQLMKERNKPIDYCIAQRLLPKIVLQGDEARKRLIKLKKYLDSKELTISSGILSSIIKHGKDGMFEDNYDYFLTLSHV